MDADFSHPPKDLLNLYAACHTGGADVSVGSRYVNNLVSVVNWPIGRILMSYFASIYVRIITGLKVKDTTAGFVCYTRRVLKRFELDKIRFKGYAFQIEMKFTAFKYGNTITWFQTIGMMSARQDKRDTGASAKRGKRTKGKDCRTESTDRRNAHRAVDRKSVV